MMNYLGDRGFKANQFVSQYLEIGKPFSLSRMGLGEIRWVDYFIRGGIDILLDDGSHITNHQINTFNILYKNIKKGGFYIIEDLTNSYEEQLNHHNLRAIWSV